MVTHPLVRRDTGTAHDDVAERDSRVDRLAVSMEPLLLSSRRRRHFRRFVCLLAMRRRWAPRYDGLILLASGRARRVWTRWRW